MAGVIEVVAGVVGGLAMATCVIVVVRVVQLRRRRQRQAQLGLGADERRFKRRLEQSIAEVDNIFADDEDDDDDDDDDEEAAAGGGGGGDLEDEGLDEEDREQLKLIEAEAATSPKKKSCEWCGVVCWAGARGRSARATWPRLVATPGRHSCLLLHPVPARAATTSPSRVKGAAAAPLPASSSAPATDEETAALAGPASAKR